jgi:predicted small metal-binding protein
MRTPADHLITILGRPDRGDGMENDCYELRCSDMGTQCNYVAKGQTMDEMMEKAMKHDADVHNHEGGYSDEEMLQIKAAVKHHDEC